MEGDGLGWKGRLGWKGTVGMEGTGWIIRSRSLTSMPAGCHQCREPPPTSTYHLPAAGESSELGLPTFYTKAKKYKKKVVLFFVCVVS